MVHQHDVRSYALSLPEVEEIEHWGKASFRVRGRIFAVIQEDETSFVVKTNQDEREALTTMQPDAFSVPAGFSHLNYMLVQMEQIDFEEMKRLITEGWRMRHQKSWLHIIVQASTQDRTFDILDLEGNESQPEFEAGCGSCGLEGKAMRQRSMSRVRTMTQTLFTAAGIPESWSRKSSAKTRLAT